jgi:hypothetical protein
MAANPRRRAASVNSRFSHQPESLLRPQDRRDVKLRYAPAPEVDIPLLDQGGVG